MNLQNQTIKKEIVDIKIFFIPLFSTIFIWYFFLSWNGLDLLANNDGIYGIIPEIIELARGEGKIINILYAFNRIGGMDLNNSVGTVWLFQLLVKLKAHPITILNIFVILIQTIFAFFSIKFIINLRFLFYEGKGPYEIKVVTILSIVGLLAFAPITAWRISYGHPRLLLGAINFLVLFSFILSLKYKNCSLTQYLLSIFVFFTTTQVPAAYQTTYYSFIFGSIVLLPFIISFNMKNKKFWHKFISNNIIFIIPLVVFLGAVILNLPRIWGIFETYLGGNSPRMADGNFIYSYTTNNLKDFISSIFWSNELIKTRSFTFFLQETNYPLGPILLFIFLLPWRKRKSLIYGSVSALILIFAISMNIRPISTIMVDYLPMMKNFRVPARSFLILFLMIPALAISPLIGDQAEKTEWKLKKVIVQIVILIPFVLTILFLPVIIQEIVCWLFTIFIILLYVKKIPRAILIKSQKYLSYNLILLVLSLFSIVAFKQRPLPFFKAHKLFSGIGPLSDRIKKRQPVLNNPLNRINIQFLIPGIATNQSEIFNISTIDGYTYFPQRSRSLLCDLDHPACNHSSIYLHIKRDFHNFNILQQLYNIRFSLIYKNKTYHLDNLSKTLGPYWFSKKIVLKDSSHEIINLFKNKKVDMIQKLLLENQYIIKKDIHGISTDFSTANCSNGKVSDFQVDPVTKNISFRITSQSMCPLTISTNYSIHFQASIINQFTNKKIGNIPVYPSYGILTGMVTPPGNYKVVMAPQQRYPSILCWVVYLTFILLLLPPIYIFKKTILLSPLGEKNDR